ncbi:MAG: hypothetical protein IPL35_07750 [Sphingobacteriales bacterium]|nr:hypothetical protein [Sphingobacteriales bacterium]
MIYYLNCVNVLLGTLGLCFKSSRSTTFTSLYPGEAFFSLPSASKKIRVGYTLLRSLQR